MTFCNNLLKSFSENLKQLTKMNDFLLFLRFHENRRILHCFSCRYGFCLQKYTSKCIFIEFPCKTQFRLNLSKAITLRFSRFSQKFLKFLIWLYLSSFPPKNIILWLFVTICSRVSVKISNNEQKWIIFYYFFVFMKTIGFFPVFIADMNFACRNILVSVYLLNFHIRQNFGWFYQRL